MRRLVPLLLIALVGCGSAPNAAPTDARADAEVFARQIAAMKEGERNAVFVRAIRDAKQPCQSVVASQAIQRGWIATCSDGSHWSVVPQAGGIALVSPVRGLPDAG